jgi:hypothetical protein
LCGWVNVVPKSIPSYGVLSFPFICQGAEVGSTRERLPVSRFSSSLRVVPAGAVDDDGVVPAPPPGATCDMCLNRVGVRGPPACLVGDVRPDKIGGVSPRRVLRLDLWCGGRPGLAIMACPYLPPHQRFDPQHDVSFCETLRAPHPCVLVRPNLCPRGRAKRSSPSGSGEAGFDLWRMGEVARALLLGLVLGRWCPSFWWGIYDHATTSIRLGRILRESQTVISFLSYVLSGGS